MLYLFLFALLGILWGFATNYVIKEKGYDEEWFWLGFFFQLMAFVVAWVKLPYDQTAEGQRVKKQISEIRQRDTLQSGGWKCTCGRLNAAYVTSCTCGKTKIQSEIELESASADAQAEKLRNYKELLDSGIITQEDFDAKKKQILGL